MRAVVQRVRSASVSVNGSVVGSCGKGLLLLVGAHKDDTEKDAEKLADRIAGLRIFGDAEGKMNLSLADAGADGVLAVSNFTVYGDALKSRRPSFVASAGYEDAQRLFDHFVTALRAKDVKVETGTFGAMMDVQLTNDGPVTIVIDC